jgi:Calx-beta domain/Tyrosine-protein kinase ephrin type A/B receptor-like
MRRIAIVVLGVLLTGTVATVGSVTASAVTPCGANGVFTVDGGTLTCTYDSVGADTFTVPTNGVTALNVVAIGGGGAAGSVGAGGDGASVTSSLVVDSQVAAGQVLDLFVGGGGTNGGGTNGMIGSGSGGGSSTVEPTSAFRIIAGGGGGGDQAAVGGSAGVNADGSGGPGGGVDPDGATGGGGGIGGHSGGGNAVDGGNGNGGPGGHARLHGVGGAGFNGGGFGGTGDTFAESIPGGSGGGGGGGYGGGGGGAGNDVEGGGSGGAGGSIGPAGTVYAAAATGGVAPFGTGGDGSIVISWTGVATPCEKGFSSATGLEPCVPADPGHFVSDTGSTTQSLCQPGSFQNLSGQSSCTPCPAGTTTTAPGATACVTAPDAPKIVPGSASVVEGSGGGVVELNIPVALSQASPDLISVQYRSVFAPNLGGNQADPATDYTAVSGELDFAPGETTHDITIDVNSDSLVEPDEYVIVQLFDPSVNARLGGIYGLGFGTIINDDHASVVPGGASVVEGNAGTTELDVPVTLSNPSTQTVTVQWRTVFVPGAAGNQADPATDYTSASGTVTFTPGETTATVPILVNGDTTIEPDEFLVVQFGKPTNATMGGFYGLGFGIIINDDAGGCATPAASPSRAVEPLVPRPACS